MQLVFDFPLKPEYSFANFARCRGNETAIAFAGKLLAGDGEENLLYLYGEKGSGKTHLLTAIAKEISSTRSDSLPVISASDLTPENSAETFSFLATLPALLLDDLHLLADDARIRTALWQLFNDFYQTGRKIVATAILPPKEVDCLDAHLQSRFMWGLVAKLDISDDDSRRIILRKLAEDRNILLPDEVIDYFLVHLPRDIPALTESLDRLRLFSLASKRKISIRLAREILAQSDGQDPI
jgi:chromosomal replication initiator protein